MRGSSRNSGAEPRRRASADVGSDAARAPLLAHSQPSNGYSDADAMRAAVAASMYVPPQPVPAPSSSSLTVPAAAADSAGGVGVARSVSPALSVVLPPVPEPSSTPPALFSPGHVDHMQTNVIAPTAVVGNTAPRGRLDEAAAAAAQPAMQAQKPVRSAMVAPATVPASQSYRGAPLPPPAAAMGPGPAAAGAGSDASRRPDSVWSGQSESRAASRRNSGVAAAAAAEVEGEPVPVTSTFFHACTDYHPLLGKRHEYFHPDSPTELPSGGPIPAARPRSSSSLSVPPDVRDVISVVVPCFTESGRNLQKTLYDLWLMQDYMHRNRTYFHFHVCIILDGWSKAPPSLQAYIRQLFESEDEQEAVKFSTLQKEMQQAEESAAYPDEPSPTQRKKVSSTDISSCSASDASEDSDADSEQEGDEERGLTSGAHKSRRKGAGMRDVKFDSTGGASSKNSRQQQDTLKSSSASVSRSPGEGDFLFPESITFSSHPDRNVQSKTKSWERYISNWSADSDLNPPTQPETLIVQKWTTVGGGEGGGALPRRSIQAVPLFPGLDDEQLDEDGAPRAPSGSLEELRKKQRAALKMTVIIKRDNRRKHNSHEWFLTAFAPVYTTRLRTSRSSSANDGIQFVFMTDAGTRFHESCVLSLVQHSLQSPTTVACSGRQRVMTHAMQNEGEPPVDKLSINFLRGQLYRCAQGFEYEGSQSSFSGAFTLTGMLPVLPGPCGLFRLDIMLREGDAVQQERARQQEQVRLQVGRLRSIHQNENKALFALHSYVWSSLTVNKQMHRATWAAYCKRNAVSSQSMRGGGNGADGVLVPFTPFEKAEAQFKFLELKTQLFALTNELQHNQLLLITVLLRLDADSVCLHGLPQMLAQESVVWQRMQSLLVLVKQLHELESSYSTALAEGAMNSKLLSRDWDRQMHAQLEQLRRLMTQQIYQLKEYLLRIEQADGGLLSVVRRELSLDQEEQDHLLDARRKAELAASRDPVEFYFSVVNQVPSEVDMITANLLLAEDRVLSYAVVLMAHEPVHTDFVPDALFFFEAETEAENALQQARRWTNGTVAGFLFLWPMFSGIRFRQSRYLVYFLVMCQLVMYIIVGLSPALWTIGLHYSLGLWFADAPARYADYLVALYLGLYAAFVLMHSDPTPGKPRLHVWLFHVLTVVNMGVATMPIAALVPQFIHGCRDNSGWMQVAGMSLQCWILGSTVAGTLVLPFVLAVLYDLYSLLPACNKRPVARRLRNCPYGMSWVWHGWGSVTYEMVTSAIFFYLFLPTKVSIYPCYAFSRTWELTWGNKPSDSLHSITSNKTARQLEATKKSSLQLAQVISHSLLLCNILLFLIVSELGVKSGVLVVLTAFILLWALLQMGMSLVWILYRLLIAPFFKALRILAEWLSIVAVRPVPGGYEAAERAREEREERRRAKREAKEHASMNQHNVNGPGPRGRTAAVAAQPHAPAAGSSSSSSSSSAPSQQQQQQQQKRAFANTDRAGHYQALA